jgi:hypothetical protein
VQPGYQKARQSATFQTAAKNWHLQFSRLDFRAARAASFRPVAAGSSRAVCTHWRNHDDVQTVRSRGNKGGVPLCASVARRPPPAIKVLFELSRET